MQSKRASKTHILSPPFSLLYSCISLHFFHAILSHISLFVVVCFLLQEIIFISQIFVFFLFFILPCSSSLYFMLPMCTAWRRPIVRHSDTACHSEWLAWYVAYTQPDGWCEQLWSCCQAADTLERHWQLLLLGWVTQLLLLCFVVIVVVCCCCCLLFGYYWGSF